LPRIAIFDQRQQSLAVGQRNAEGNLCAHTLGSQAHSLMRIPNRALTLSGLRHASIVLWSNERGRRSAVTFASVAIRCKNLLTNLNHSCRVLVSHPPMRFVAPCGDGHRQSIGSGTATTTSPPLLTPATKTASHVLCTCPSRPVETRLAGRNPRRDSSVRHQRPAAFISPMSATSSSLSRTFPC
jgi:hypothetical protein